MNNVVSINKEMVKNDFVNASILINKAKKKARETDLYLKKLHEKVLPRCQAADITSDIVKRLFLIVCKYNVYLWPMLIMALLKAANTNL